MARFLVVSSRNTHVIKCRYLVSPSLYFSASALLVNMHLGIGHEFGIFDEMTTKTYSACPGLRAAVQFSLVIQAFIVILAAFMTDGGAAGQIAFFAFVSFNSYLVSVLVFRPKNPTKIDLILIRAGLIPTILITGFLVNYIWDLRGF